MSGIEPCSAERELAARLYERPEQTPKRPCPECSGYEHQRHECERCDGTGMVEVKHGCQ